MKHILLFTAGLIIFLHSIVPHEHHGEISEQEDIVLHSANECICDWLQLVFHDDLGAGHLEHFIQSEELTAPNKHLITTGNPVYILSPHYSESTPSSDVNTGSPFTSNTILSFYLRYPETLRGPPSFV